MRARVWWIVGCGVVAVTALLLTRPVPSTGPSAAPVPESTTSALPRGPLPSARPGAAREHAVDGTTPPVASLQPVASECRHSDDCRSAKLPDCVVPKCAEGRCLYDRSTCECTSDEDCDDGIECTRDVCFARTKKCVFIRSACE